MDTTLSHSRRFSTPLVLSTSKSTSRLMRAEAAQGVAGTLCAARDEIAATYLNASAGASGGAPQRRRQPAQRVAALRRARRWLVRTPGQLAPVVVRCVWRVRMCVLGRFFKPHARCGLMHPDPLRLG